MSFVQKCFYLCARATYHVPITTLTNASALSNSLEPRHVTRFDYTVRIWDVSFGVSCLHILRVRGSILDGLPAQYLAFQIVFCCYRTVLLLSLRRHST